MTVDYVVDTSIVIQYAIADTLTPHVETLFDEWGESSKLYVPEFCIVECANVLWKQVRFYGTEQARAELLLLDLVALPLTLAQAAPLLSAALQIGLTHQLAVYDSIYIALAKSLSCPLITADERQERAARASGVSIKPVTDFPPSHA
jgi:predicted nucleic acid-binding protein